MQVPEDHAFLKLVGFECAKFQKSVVLPLAETCATCPQGCAHHTLEALRRVIGLAALVQGQRAAAHQALVTAAMGVVVYTLAQHQTLVRQGRVSEGQVADTHTSWIQLHGTGVRPALTALGGNLLCNSEIKRGKVAPEQDMNPTFETAVGRGV